MTQPLTHDPADRAQHLADSVEDTRTPQGEAEGYVPIFECDDCDPGEVKGDDEVESGLASFALASLEVALDATPGSDDDYLYAQESIVAESFDGQVPGQVDVTLRDGRTFRVTAKAERLDGEKRGARFSDFLAAEDARFKPYTDALEKYAPLFTRVDHTGGGCMALIVTMDAADALVAITDIDGPWNVGLYKSQQEWDEPTQDPDFLEIDHDVTADELAGRVVAMLTERGILTAPVAREE